MTDAEPPPTGPTLTPAASAGSTPAGDISIRPLEADDAHRLQDLARRVSPTSGYFRFFVPMPTLREPLLTHLVSVDHQDREALAAVAGDQVVGVARYDRMPTDPNTCLLYTSDAADDLLC